MPTIALSHGTSSDVNSVAVALLGADQGDGVEEAGQHPVHPAQQGQVVERRRPGVSTQEPAGPQGVQRRPMGVERIPGTAVEQERLGLGDHLGHGHDPAVEVPGPMVGCPCCRCSRLLRRAVGEIDQDPTR